MRLFLAINLDPDARRALHDAVTQLRDAAPGLLWTREDKLHLTLRFLGDTDDDAPHRIAPAMHEVAISHRRFPMALRHVGAFPDFRRARVVWLGADASARLELLHHDVETACHRLGFGLEGRPFRPHVTLARVRDRDGDAMRRLARVAKRLEFEWDVHVESVDLMRSTPGSGGSTYQRLNASPLAGG